MKRCPKCQVEVAGADTRCPLCQGPLQPVDDRHEAGIFPVLPTAYRRHSLFFRILILCSIAVTVVCLVINFLLPQGGWWSLFVAAGVGCMWLSLAISIRKRHNVFKNMLYQVVAAATVVVLWDAWTGWHGWSLDYVVPILCMATLIAMGILALVKRWRVQDYLIYLAIICFFCVAPIAFLLLGWVQTAYPTLICVGGSVISLAALLAFRGGNMLQDLKRRLHL